MINFIFFHYNHYVIYDNFFSLPEPKVSFSASIKLYIFFNLFSRISQPISTNFENKRTRHLNYMLDLKICSNRWYRFEHWRTTTIFRNHPEKKGLPQTSFRKTIIRNSASLAIDIYIITIWKHLFISTLISTERMLIFKCYLMKE